MKKRLSCIFLFLFFAFLHSTTLCCSLNQIIDLDENCVELFLGPSDRCSYYSSNINSELTNSTDIYTEANCYSRLQISEFKIRMENRFKSLFGSNLGNHYIKIELEDGAFLFYKYREDVPNYGFHIDFSKCVKILQRKLELDDNIYLALIYKKEVGLNFVKNYAFFDDTGRELDLEYCEREGERLMEYVDFRTSAIKSDLPHYRKHDVNIFDKDHDFFNSKCARLSINNKDTTYIERRQFFYNETYWPANCSYEIDYIHSQLIYNCSIVKNGFNSTINRTVNGDFTKKPRNSGAYLYDCHNYYMTKKSHLLYSYGNYFMIIIIFLIIIFMIAHCITVHTYIMNSEKKYFAAEEDKARERVKMDEMENGTKIITKKRNKNDETFDNKKKIKNEQSYDNNENDFQKDIDRDEVARMKANPPPKKAKDEKELDENIAKDIKSLSEIMNESLGSSHRHLNEGINKANLSGSNYKKPVIIDAFRDKEEPINHDRRIESKDELNEYVKTPDKVFQHGDRSYDKSYSISYSYSLDKKKEEAKEIEEIIQPVPEEPEPEPPKPTEKVYNDEELSLMNYDNAIIHDDRSFCRYYCFLLKHKFLLISSFTFIKSYYYYYPYTIRICLFFFELASMLFFNAIFVDDKRIRKRFLHVGPINYLYTLKKELGYSFAAMLITFLLRKCCDFFIYLLKKRLYYQNIKDLKERQRKILKNIFKLRVGTVIFFFLILFFSFWFWFYLVIFCGVLRHSQLPLLFDFINSILFYIIFILIICLVPGCVKYIGRKNKDK